MTYPHGTGRLADVVAASSAVAATRSRTAKITAIAGALAGLGPQDATIAASFLAGTPRQERLDVGWAALRDLAAEPSAIPAATTSLSLAQVDAALQTLSQLGGTGSRAGRLAVLRTLLAKATADEQQFLRGLVLGELRHGALAGVVAQAIARAAGVEIAAVQRAVMLTGDLGTVAGLVRSGGAPALTAVGLTLFRPVQPMLASPSAGIESVVQEMVGDAAAEDNGDKAVVGVAVEHKLDGARVQVHRRGDRVAVYTRNLRDATERSGQVVAVALSLDAESFVLDGEVLGIRGDGRPEAFADTMSGFGRTRQPATRVLAPFFFDVLQVDGRDLLDCPTSERMAVLDDLVPAAHRVPRQLVTDADGAAAVFAQALAAGQEGVIVKALDAPYAAGRRGAAWRKVKPVHTLDLVVLAVEWGSGRRKGWLSNLHLGARDPDGDGFVMLGKTFKGMTDELLEWQTRRFLALETGRDGHVVTVRPEQVVEIACDGIQTSRRYPGGVALRFARVKRYRDDKDADQADTLATVRALGGGALVPDRES